VAKVLQRMHVKSLSAIHNIQCIMFSKDKLCAKSCASCCAMLWCADVALSTPRVQLAEQAGTVVQQGQDTHRLPQVLLSLRMRQQR
jgi:hypothetical protein